MTTKCLSETVAAIAVVTASILWGCHVPSPARADSQVLGPLATATTTATSGQMPTPVATSTNVGPPSQSFRIEAVRSETPESKLDWSLVRAPLKHLTVAQTVRVVVYVYLEFAPVNSSLTITMRMFRDGKLWHINSWMPHKNQVENHTNYGFTHVVTLNQPGSLTVVGTASLNGESKTASTSYNVRTVPGDVAYIAHGRLWIRSLSALKATVLETPWLVSGVLWSPDGHWLAIEDRFHRLAVIDPTTRQSYTLADRPHQVRASSRWACCALEAYHWAPNSRYLAFFKPAADGASNDLWVWDDARKESTRKAAGVPVVFGSVQWAHDSSRLAVTTRVVGAGAAGPAKNPRIDIINLAGGSPLSLGAGEDPIWSPDDRFIGYSLNQSCRMRQCFGARLVALSSGGTPTTLVSRISNWLVNEEWRLRSNGYSFDQWVLDNRAGVLQRVTLTGERVDAWSPDGLSAVKQSPDPAVSGHIQLRLMSFSNGSRTLVYAGEPSTACRTCAPLEQQVLWNRTGDWFVFVSPQERAPNNTVSKPTLRVYHPATRKLERATFPAYHVAELLGVTAREENVLLRLDANLYRYDERDHVLIRLASSTSPSADQSYLSSLAAHA